MQSAPPKEVIAVLEKLQLGGYKAYIVGGSVRALLMQKEPKDWDLTTDATPEQIERMFEDTVYENDFGTVGIKTGSEDPKISIIELTTFRCEENYTDNRHPGKVTFTKSLEEDLARRDFTINAIALSPEGDIIDPFNGKEDLRKEIVRAVGNPKERFGEDALRLMRAVRISAELNFEIEEETQKAIRACASLLQKIAQERIRDELARIIMYPRAKEGIETLEDMGLLEYIIPELREGIDVGQNKHHIYSVWEHNLRALGYSVGKNYSFTVRMASLLHDVGKPAVKRGDGPDSTFYNHEVVGAKMARKILKRLHFSNQIIEDVTHLVRWHLFYYNVGEVSEAGVRRFLRKVGPEYIEDLLRVREADRIGSGVPKAVPYKLRHLKFMIEKVKTDPIKPNMLKISGNDLMDMLKITPGPKIGWILSILLEEVLKDPTQNEKDMLLTKARDLSELSDAELKEKATSAADKKEEFESGIEEEMKKKYYVK